MTQDDLSKRVEVYWDHVVAKQGRYSVPCLDLTREQVQAYAQGQVADLADAVVYPFDLLQGVGGRSVLCLASGGGQQSVAFGLMGAQVTVLDISEGMLEGDRAAARHHQLDIEIVKGDMRDLSAFPAAHFDLIYQPISITFVPDVREVYREVHRVLRPGGVYRVAHCNPATYPTSFDGGVNGWDGQGYRIADPYCGGPIRMLPDGRESMLEGAPTGEHRHLFGDIFNGLTELGFVIERVTEDPRHFTPQEGTEPGSHAHSLATIAQYFTVVTRKPA